MKDGSSAILVRAAASLLALGPIARADSQAASTSAGSKPSEEGGATPTIALVVGQVTDDLGQGQSSVRVRLVLAGEGDASTAIGEAKTDAMGDFAIRVAAPFKGDAVLVLTKDGYAELRRQITVGESERPLFVAVSLEGAFALTGIVRGALEDQPVGQAEFTVRCAFRDWTAKSDAEGKFRVEGLPPGEAEIVIEAPGFARMQRMVRIGPDTPEQNFALKPERIVELVIANEEGRPIAQASVDVLERTQDDFRSLISDSQGRVEVRGLSIDAEQLLIRLSHPEHASSDGFAHAVQLPPSEVRSTHSLVMARAGKVVGVVRDQEEHPRNGARVSAGADAAGAPLRAWSNHEGRYEIVGVPAGLTVVTVHLAGFAPDLREVDVRAGEAATADFQLLPAGTVEGEVVFKSGRAAAGITVMSGNWRGHATLALRARTDANGRFALYDTPLDEFELVVAGLSAEDAPPTLVKGTLSDSVRISIPEIPTGRGPTTGAGLKVGSDAPAFKMTTLDQQTLELAGLRGKVVFLDFWATWCGPCLMEVPDLKKLNDRLRGHKDFVMIGVSLDHDETALRKFLQDEGIAWAQVFGAKGGAEEAANRFGAFALPSTFVVDREGKVAGVHVHGKELEDLLTKLLGEGDSE